MKATETSLLTMMMVTNQQFVIPIYQREYSWKSEQCLRLWQDVEAAAQGVEPTHFFGSIVYIKAEDDAPVTSGHQCLVIDGQQRLTTVMLMLVALRTLLADGTHAASIDAETINDYYLYNKHAKGDQRYKLMLRDDDQRSLMNILDKGDTVGVTQKRLRENYELLSDLMRKAPVDLDSIYAGMGRLTVVDVSLTRKEDNPQRIFESLNSTGLDLTQSDRVRNFILMDLEPRLQERLYHEYWQPTTRLVFDETQDIDHFDEFLRDYLTMESPTGEIPSRDHVYEAFREYARQHVPNDAASIASDLHRYAAYYSRMLRPKYYSQQPVVGHDDPTKATPAILAALHDISRLDMSVSYPFVLEAFDDYACGRLTEVDFVSVLRMIESYVMRRLVCSIPANALNKVFARLSREVDKSQYIESLGAALAGMKGSQRLPTDDEFREAFKSKDVYHQQARIKYILERLENYGKGELISISDNALSVEHVMPQTLNDGWRTMLGDQWQSVHATRLHTLGNLTLTGYNSSYSNLSFLEKRDMVDQHTGNVIGFKGSPVTLNQDLAQRDSWNEQAILERTERLATLACAVWPAPVVSAGRNGESGAASPSVDTVLAHVFPEPGQLAYAQELTAKLVSHLDPNSTAHLLAVTCSEDRISLDVGNWLMLGFERSKTGKSLIKLAVDKSTLSDSDKVTLHNLNDFSGAGFIPGGPAFEAGRYGLVGKEWIGPEPVSDKLVSAWLAAIEESNTLFRSWKTGAFSWLHRQDLVERLVPGVTPKRPYEHFLQGKVGDLYDEFKRRLLDLDADLDEERMAVYIAYKLESNVLTIVPKSDHLTVFLDMPFEEVVDHDDMIHDVSEKGHFGTGEVMFDIGDLDQMEAATDLASQSLRWHAEH
jgi:uncharacterized protein with ParB-like and HNH nuclease domain/predicted transport protein